MTNVLYDCSNYTTRPLTPDVLDAWVATDCKAVMIQCLDPPRGYPAGQTRDQISRVLDYGLPVIYYPFWWYGAGVDYLKRHMDTMSGFEGKLAAGVIDAEDTTVTNALMHPSFVQRARGVRFTPPPLPASHLARIGRQPQPDRRQSMKYGASTQSLIDDIAAWVEYMRTFPTITGMIGWYSGPWYEPYLGGTTWPADNGLYSHIAQYNGVMDLYTVTPCFGYSPPVDVHQYAGSVVVGDVGGIDANVMSDEFYGHLTAQPEPTPDPQPDPSPDPQAERIAALEGALGDVTGADGEIVKALQPLLKMTRSKTMRGDIQAIISRLGEIHKEFLE